MTDANGEARTTLTASRTATMKATVGGVESNSIVVTVDDALGLDVDVSANPTAGATTTFSIVVTVPAGANPASRVEIDFGDGESRSLNVPSTGGTTTVAHIYDEDGTYTVRVRVIDTAGRTQSQDLVIAVQPADSTRYAHGVRYDARHGPVRDVHGARDRRHAPPPTSGRSATARGEHDGSTSSTTHTYNSTGSKTVRVRAIAANGSEARDDLVVTVH